jgi:hypothetical protein
MRKVGQRALKADNVGLHLALVGSWGHCGHLILCQILCQILCHGKAASERARNGRQNSGTPRQTSFDHQGVSRIRLQVPGTVLRSMPD